MNTVPAATGPRAAGEAEERLAGDLELSIVVPVYYNAGSLEELHRRIAATMTSAGVRGWDLTFVDDGSGDASPTVLEELRRRHGNVRVLRLSRNFGSNAAIHAGLEHARGRCVAVLAADLQDPPEMLGVMIERWRQGTEVVLASRESRDDPFLTRLASSLFYRLFRALVSRDMPTGGFDFFLLDRKVARVLVEFAEKNANIGASVLWVGFRREFVPYHRAERTHGKSMWTLSKKLKYMYDSLLSYSYVPLRFMTAGGLVGMLLAASYAAWIIIDKLVGGTEPQGWSSLMVVTLFFNGFVLTAVGTVGEYVWRTFDASRRRPFFIVAQHHEPACAREAPAERRA
jgi:dolichol-phosphate mannosyltransferase